MANEIVTETEKIVSTPASTVTSSTQVVPPSTGNSTNTAVLGGSLIGLPGINTILLGLVAFFGIGEMPNMVELQHAIANLGFAGLGALLLWFNPGTRPVNNVIVKTNTVENKVE